MNSMNDILASKARELFPNAPEITQQFSVAQPTGAVHTQVLHYIQEIEDRLKKIKSLLGEGHMDTVRVPGATTAAETEILGENVHEGVFNGEVMVSSDGQTFPVPPNYASKSKLVEGDMLKVTVRPDGSLIFKQIGPTERDRKIGELVLAEDGNFCVNCNGYSYCVLRAAITYHKGKHGDKVVILVPKDSPSTWAAVEYIVTD